MSKLNTPAIAGIEYHFYKVLPDNAMLWFFFLINLRNKSAEPQKEMNSDRV